MTGILLIGGKGPDKKYFRSVIKNYNFVIAADSGFDLALSLEIKPDLIVGDMDSILDKETLNSFPAEKIIQYPKDKDETDTEIGLRIFNDMGYNNIALAGGGEGRLDHLFGILNIFKRKYHPNLWITKREEVYYISKQFHKGGWRGSTVSIFPVGKSAGGMSSIGLKWPLNGLIWEEGFYGISNLVTEDELYISVDEGELLLIKNNNLEGNKHD